MDFGIIRQFRVEGEPDLVPVFNGHDIAVYFCQNFNMFVCALDVGRADKNHRVASDSLDRFLGDKAGELSAVSVSPDGDGQRSQMGDGGCFFLLRPVCDGDADFLR